MWQKQVDLCEFEDSLVYRESSRTARTTQQNPVVREDAYSLHGEIREQLVKLVSPPIIWVLGTQM